MHQHDDPDDPALPEVFAPLDRRPVDGRTFVHLHVLRATESDEKLWRYLLIFTFAILALLVILLTVGAIMKIVLVSLPWWLAVGAGVAGTVTIGGAVRIAIRRRQDQVSAEPTR